MANDKIKASISNISFKKGNFDCPKIDNIIGDNKNYNHTITFSLNEPNKPYWEALGFNSEKEYNDSLCWLDLETGKRYSLNTGKEIK